MANMFSNTVPFNVRFNEALEVKNIRPVDISKITGISESTISQYRSGYAVPKRNKLAIISKALHVNPSWLLGLDVPMEISPVNALSNIDTDIQVEIMSDPELNAHVEKLAKLTASKQIIYDMIDMYYEKENGQ